VAYRNGSVGEILEEGVTGFIVENQDEAIAAARNIGRIDRRRCRQEFERRFAARVMASRYLEVYRELAHSLLAERLGTPQLAR
jgi:glycosyltransferase involved in cell wall biosynthesis